ncbi:MAG: 5-(carboxyamino)imidazole ribonucleotide synthase [Vampirovibrionales bacterium]
MALQHPSSSCNISASSIQTIGILGGGQLGRMSAMAAQHMGYRVVVFAPEDNPPASSVAHETIQASYTDHEALTRFAHQVDVVTLEFENIPSTTLDYLATLGVTTYPQVQALATAQHRLTEKTFFKTQGLPVAPFYEVDSPEALQEATTHLGFPCVLKTTGFGYDGKGQVILHTIQELHAAWDKLSPLCPTLIAEAWVKFSEEVSCISARNAQGEIVHYGLLHNEHRHHILHISRTGKTLTSSALQHQAETLNTHILEALNYVGLLCVEYFVCPSEEETSSQLLINEMAPRPHNSGHLTIEGAVTSQFEQHIRAICGLPLGSTAWRYPFIAMVNILGDAWFNVSHTASSSPETPAWHTWMAQNTHLKCHLYGKTEAKVGRKMGHWTLHAETQPDLETALSALTPSF